MHLVGCLGEGGRWEGLRGVPGGDRECSGKTGSVSGKCYFIPWKIENTAMENKFTGWSIRGTRGGGEGGRIRRKLFRVSGKCCLRASAYTWSGLETMVTHVVPSVRKAYRTVLCPIIPYHTVHCRTFVLEFSLSRSMRATNFDGLVYSCDIVYSVGNVAVSTTAGGSSSSNQNQKQVCDHGGIRHFWVHRRF